MQSVRVKFGKGLITKEEFINEAVNRSINCLVEQDYKFVQNLGSGGFGTVFYAIDANNENIAVKLVLQERVNLNELEIWSTLTNENVLALNDVQYIPSAETFAFIMPLHPTTLDLVLEDSVLAADRNGFDLAKSYLQDASRGVKYLHSRKLCHLDIKPSNVLISNSGKALLCDFSSLTMTEAGTDSYVSPFLYSPPEAVDYGKDKKTVVNGFSYDAYTIGILALELFTNQAVLTACHFIDLESSWSKEIYPKVFEILKKKKFENAVKKAFPRSNIDRKLIKMLRNFVKGCLCLNPLLRPSLDNILEHKIFGGSRLFQRRTNDVWKNKAGQKKLDFLISLFIARASSLPLPSDSSNTTLTIKIVNHEEKQPGCNAEEKQAECNAEAKQPECNTEAKQPECNAEEKQPKCNVENQIPTSCAKAEHVPKSDSVMEISKKQVFLQWVADKKLALYDRFNRIISTLRHSRK